MLGLFDTVCVGMIPEPLIWLVRPPAGDERCRMLLLLLGKEYELVGIAGRIGALALSSLWWIGKVVVDVDGVACPCLKRLLFALASTSIADTLVRECAGSAADVEVEVETWLPSPLLFDVLVRRTKRFMRCRREEVRVIVCEGTSGAFGSAALGVVVLGLVVGMVAIGV